MKKSLFKNQLLLVLILSVFISCGQSNRNEKTEPPPFIEVTGTAEKEVVPDEIYISVTLKNKVVGQENYTISSQEENLKKSLSKINIPAKNLYLSSASSEITRYKRKETGVEESKQYILKVTSANEVSKVFEVLHDINIKEGYVQSVTHSKIDSLRKDVRIAAIKAAKDKAEYLLSAIDEEPGKPVQIIEQSPDSYNNYASNTALNVRLDRLERDDEETDFEKLKIKFSYNIKYSIK